MIPGTYNLVLYQGDDLSLTVRLKNADGTLKDLTSWTGRAQVRATAAATSVLGTLTVTISNQSTNKGELTITATGIITAALPAGAAVWDLELTDASTKVHTYLAGTVTVTAEVTR